MDRTYVERNAAGLARLRALAARCTDDELQRPIEGGWTVAALLAHLAFWDQFVLARWKWAEREGLHVPQALDSAYQDLVNDAGMSLWLACPPREALRQALAAADAVDHYIAGLDDEVAAGLLASGRAPLVDRSWHRDPHLAEIERALGDARSGCSRGIERTSDRA
jgi:hypothetical protein